MSKKIIKIASTIKSNEIRWAWIKYIYAKNDKTNNYLFKKIKKKKIFKELTLRIVQKINFFSSFFSNKKKGGSLLYCNQKHYKNIFNEFFKKINQKNNSFVYYSPISIDWIRFGLNIKKFHVSNYKWQGHEKSLSSLNFVKLIDTIIYNDLKKIKPDRIFLIEGDSYIHNLINKNAKLLKIKTITIQNGYNIFLNPVISWKNINSDIYISKGYANSKFLKNYSNTKFITTGLLNNNEDNSNKKRIYNICFILQPNKNNQFLNYIFYIAKKYEKFNFLIKLHPSSKFEIKKKISNLKNITILKKTKDVEFLRHVNFVISEFSSVLIESLQYNCVPIAVCKFYDKTILKLLPLKKLGFCFKDFKSLKKNEKKILLDKKNIHSYKNNINIKYFFDSFKKTDLKKIKNLCK